MKRFFTPLLIVLVFGAITLSIFQFATRPKIAYVNLTKLYNEFELKKQLETQLNVVQQVRQKTLDSLELGLNALSRNLKVMDERTDSKTYSLTASEFDTRRQEYMYRQKSFSEDNATLTQQYTGQIWKQLNQYVKDYGEAHGYTYILGGDGSGNIMYSEGKEELTQELIVYTNDRFKGETKTQ
jgi:outer membrane protein